MSLALNFERKCRTCGTDILELSCGIPIFGSGLQLDHKINRYLSLNISLHDDLPKCLCATCFIKIESIDKFAILAKKTEEAYLGWFKCIRANLAQHYNSPINAIQQLNKLSPTAITSGGTTISVAGPSGTTPGQKIDFNLLKQVVDEQITTNQADSALGLNLQPVKLIKPDVSIVSYSDLKLGLLIKDQELLKLILKALKWADHDPRATFDILMQRLKNTTFREILSNPNLLKDSDLIQLLKSYIGQEAFNKFTAACNPPIVTTMPSGLTIRPVLQTPPVSPQKSNALSEPSKPVSSIRITTNIAAAIAKAERRTSPVEEGAVTQMEVGVDPSLFLDEEESRTRERPPEPASKRAENVVTIKLVPAHLSKEASNEKMIPAILKCDVRNSSRHVCSSCAQTFASKMELQQHVVMTHVIAQPKPKPALEEPTSKKVIKIRVKKPKPAPPAIVEPAPKPEQILSSLNPPITIPASTSITLISPVAKPPEPIEPELIVEPIIVPQSTDIEKDKREDQAVEPEIVVNNSEQPLKPQKSVDLVKAKPKPTTKRKREKISIKLDLLPRKRARRLQEATKKTGTKLPCVQCNKKFPLKSTLKVHVKAAHSDPSKGKLACGKCDQIFKTQELLATHKLSHVAAKFNCDKCRESYPTSSALKAHKQTHNELRLHRCSNCSKSFNRAQDLKIHMIEHAPKEKNKAAVRERTSTRSTKTSVERKATRINTSGEIKPSRTSSRKAKA
ncbi:zinc finger protein 236-like [Uranotaenia lowii]|uniref:zinc finger protein 236-like n=1 Tax=Uranotaenia lowii TaxID=190385 RepID=UPI0024788285|nr:zinc finger protein 236-like [Uranotaenia lowii]